MPEIRYRVEALTATIAPRLGGLAAAEVIQHRGVRLARDSGFDLNAGGWRRPNAALGFRSTGWIAILRGSGVFQFR